MTDTVTTDHARARGRRRRPARGQGRADAVRPVDAAGRLAARRRGHHGRLGAVPAFYVISLAFSGGNTLTAACPPDRSGLAALSCLVPNKIDFSNYSTLLSSDQYPFTTWFRNTLILATGSAAGALLMGAAAAYAFSRMRFTRPADGHALAHAGADVPGGAGDHGHLPRC